MQDRLGSIGARARAFAVAFLVVLGVAAFGGTAAAALVPSPTVTGPIPATSA